MTEPRKIKPDPNCDACHGTGEVNDWVPAPFGPGNVPMPSVCECIEEQLTEEEADTSNYEIDASDAWADGPDEPDLPDEGPFVEEARMLWDDFLEAEYEERYEAGYEDW